MVIYGIPIREIDTLTGIDTLKEEITIFNRGLKPISPPYWITPPEKRQTARTGSAIVAFATEAEAKKALSTKLYIAGISCRTEKLHSVPKRQQCHSC